jgi:hypothetical protein
MTANLGEQRPPAGDGRAGLGHDAGHNRGDERQHFEQVETPRHASTRSMLIAVHLLQLPDDLFGRPRNRRRSAGLTPPSMSLGLMPILTSHT